MTTIEKYRCDACGKLYATESEAETCESYHVHPVEITECKYEPRPKKPSGDNPGVPHTMNVAMDDGSLIQYKFWRKLPSPTQEPDSSEPEPKEGE